MDSPINQVELTLNSNDVKYGGVVGESFQRRNTSGEVNTYMIVKMGTQAGTVANGTVLYFLQAAGSKYTVTDDVSTTDRNCVAGIALGAITDGYYGVVQTWGTHTAVKKPLTTGVDYFASGDQLIGNATADGKCTVVAAGTAPTYQLIGIADAITDSQASTVSAFLRIKAA